MTPVETSGYTCKTLYGCTGSGTIYELYRTANIRSKNVAVASSVYWLSGSESYVKRLVQVTPANTAATLGENTASGIMPHFCI